MTTIKISSLIFQFLKFRYLRWRRRNRDRRRQKYQKRAAPVEKILSPRMTEENLEPAVYEDITTVKRPSEPSHIIEVPSVQGVPPPVSAVYSNMTFSTISQESQWLPEVEEEGKDVTPTNVIPPYISRYDSLVTWLKNLSTGVME